MATKTKPKPKPKTREKLALPAAVSGWLNAQQVCEALGGCSRRKFQSLRRARVFPPPDRYLGRFPRWSVALVNDWCANNETVAADLESEA